ncbi:MAG: DNA polymerase III subunit beta [Clostridiales bacterium]|nr:DNA polymerase III subunit beta [Clostridiales bacterium]
MKIEKNELSKKIGQLKSIVPSRTTIEALKGVLYKDGYLIASDTNLTVKAKIEVLEEDAGGTEPFIIPDKSFDLINSLPPGEMELETGKDMVKIKIGKIRNQFRTLPAEQFAYIRDSISAEAAASISASKLKTAISHVLYAVAPGGTNQTMTGMYMECKDGKLNFVGLDGKRIAWDSIDYDGSFQLIVPRAALDKLLKLDFTGDIAITHDENGVLFRSEDYEVYTRLIQGEYFKYEKLFSHGDIYTVIDRKTFLEAINRAKLCGSAEDKAPVIFDMQGSSIKITYRDSATDYQEDVPVLEDLSSALKIAFDPRFFADSLKAFDCDNISMEFKSAKMPAILKAEDSDMTALVLPVNFREA